MMINNQQEQKTYPQGIKWTKQRKCVYDVLREAKEPLNAHQIYHLIVKDQEINQGACGSNYAVSTIYRILSAFEEQHMVSKSNWMNTGTFAYALETGEHTHYAVCLSCRKHIPLEVCPVDHVHVANGSGQFKITGHKLEVYGYCGTCQGVK